MKDTRLLDQFNEAKQILCQYDYYIHTQKHEYGKRNNIRLMSGCYLNFRRLL